MLKLVNLVAALLCAVIVPLATAGDMEAARYQQFQADYPAFRKAEADMSRAYSAVLQALDADEAQALKRQQHAWLDERGALVEDDDSESEEALVAKLKQMSDARASQLKAFADTVKRAVNLELEEAAAARVEARNTAIAEADETHRLAVREKAEAEQADIQAAKNQKNEERLEMVLWAVGLVVAALFIWTIVVIARKVGEYNYRKHVRRQCADSASELGQKIAVHTQAAYGAVAAKLAKVEAVNRKVAAEDALAKMLRTGVRP